MIRETGKKINLQARLYIRRLNLNKTDKKIITSHGKNGCKFYIALLKIHCSYDEVGEGNIDGLLKKINEQREEEDKLTEEKLYESLDELLKEKYEQLWEEDKWSNEELYELWN